MDLSEFPSPRLLFVTPERVTLLCLVLKVFAPHSSMLDFPFLVFLFFLGPSATGHHFSHLIPSMLSYTSILEGSEIYGHLSSPSSSAPICLPVFSFGVLFSFFKPPLGRYPINVSFLSFLLAVETFSKHLVHSLCT